MKSVTPQSGTEVSKVEIDDLLNSGDSSLLQPVKNSKVARSSKH
jgi:hypothetical protein